MAEMQPTMEKQGKQDVSHHKTNTFRDKPDAMHVGDRSD